MTADQADAVVTLLKLIAVELGLLLGVVIGWALFRMDDRAG